MSFIKSDNSLNPSGITINPTSNFIGIINNNGTLLTVGNKQNVLNISNISSSSYANINFINNSNINAFIGIGGSNSSSINSSYSNNFFIHATCNIILNANNNSSINPHLFIDKSGNIGIGTSTNLNSNFTINGSLSVGNITSLGNVIFNSNLIIKGNLIGSNQILSSINNDIISLSNTSHYSNVNIKFTNNLNCNAFIGLGGILSSAVNLSYQNNLFIHADTASDIILNAGNNTSLTNPHLFINRFGKIGIGTSFLPQGSFVRLCNSSQDINSGTILEFINNANIISSIGLIGSNINTNNDSLLKNLFYIGSASNISISAGFPIQPQIFLHNSGNIGIGTNSNLNSNFTINGSLSVGNITSLGNVIFNSNLTVNTSGTTILNGIINLNSNLIISTTGTTTINNLTTFNSNVTVNGLFIGSNQILTSSSNDIISLSNTNNFFNTNIKFTNNTNSNAIIGIGGSNTSNINSSYANNFFIHATCNIILNANNNTSISSPHLFISCNNGFIGIGTSTNLSSNFNINGSLSVGNITSIGNVIFNSNLIVNTSGTTTLNGIINLNSNLVISTTGTTTINNLTTFNSNITVNGIFIGSNQILTSSSNDIISLSNTNNFFNTNIKFTNNTNSNAIIGIGGSNTSNINSSYANNFFIHATCNIILNANNNTSISSPHLFISSNNGFIGIGTSTNLNSNFNINGSLSVGNITSSGNIIFNSNLRVNTSGTTTLNGITNINSNLVISTTGITTINNLTTLNSNITVNGLFIGSNQILTSSSNDIISLSNTNNFFNTNIKFTNNTNSNAIIGIGGSNTSNINSSYSNNFFIHATCNIILNAGNNTSTTTPHLLINNNGNIGIGCLPVTNTNLLVYGNYGISHSGPNILLSAVDINNFSTNNFYNAFAGDTNIYSFWGVSINLNSSGGNPSGNATNARINRTSSFTINQKATGGTSTSGFATIFTVRQNGNVGIGTTNPNSKLHIYEISGTDASPTSGSLIIQHENSGGVSSITFPSINGSATGDYAYIKYIENVSSTSSYTNYNYFNVGSNESGALIIGCENDSNLITGPDSVIINPAGNIALVPNNGITYITGRIGIGITNPLSTDELTLSNSSSIDYANIKFLNNLNCNAIIGIGGTAYTSNSSYSNNFFIQAQSNIILNAGNNLISSNPHLFISSNGNIGIGTSTNLNCNLTVNGSLSASIIYENGKALSNVYISSSGGTSGNINLQNNLSVNGAIIANNFIYSDATYLNNYSFEYQNSNYNFPPINNFTSNNNSYSNLNFGNGSYIISASTFSNNSNPYLVFDGNSNSLSNSWFSSNFYASNINNTIPANYIGSCNTIIKNIGNSNYSINGEWIQLYYNRGFAAKQLTINSIIRNSNSFPYNFSLVSSYDNSNWQLLSTQSNVILNSSGSNTFTFNNNTAYDYYRLIINQTSNSSNVIISEMNYQGTPNSTYINADNFNSLLYNTDIIKFPPSSNFTASTETLALNNEIYCVPSQPFKQTLQMSNKNNDIYTIYSSSSFGNVDNYKQKLFDNNFYYTINYTPSVVRYSSSSPFDYLTASFSSCIGLPSSPSFNIKGEWLIIKFPFQIILSSFNIYYYNLISGNSSAPSAWRCYGSDDGITFNEITDASQITQLTSANYTVNTNNNYLYNYNKQLNNKPKPYLYLAWVFTNLIGSGGLLMMSEFQIFGYDNLSSVLSRIRIDGTGTVYFNAFGGTISDKRYKRNINRIESKEALNIINKLDSITYNLIDDNSFSSGLIAQDVKEILPFLVNEIDRDNNKTKQLTLNYLGLIPYLIESTKELTNIINNKNKIIENLQDQINDIKRIIYI